VAAIVSVIVVVLADDRAAGVVVFGGQHASAR